MFDHSGIWLGDTAEKDSYRDFLCKFTLSAVGKLTLKVSADSKFVCFLNGKLCGIGARVIRPRHSQCGFSVAPGVLYV